MKARLLNVSGELQLLLCTGRVVVLSDESAKEFLLNFDDPSYYSGGGKWDYGFPMEEYEGDEIAFVDDEWLLCIRDAKSYRTYVTPKSIKYLTVPEYAAMHGKQPGIIRRFCIQNRLVGAIQKGTKWLIPEDSPYPADERVRKN